LRVDGCDDLERAGSLAIVQRDLDLGSNVAASDKTIAADGCRDGCVAVPGDHGRGEETDGSRDGESGLEGKTSFGGGDVAWGKRVVGDKDGDKVVAKGLAKVE